MAHNVNNNRSKNLMNEEAQLVIHKDQERNPAWKNLIKKIPHSKDARLPCDYYFIYKNVSVLYFDLSYLYKQPTFATAKFQQVMNSSSPGGRSALKHICVLNKDKVEDDLDIIEQVNLLCLDYMYKFIILADRNEFEEILKLLL